MWDPDYKESWVGKNWYNCGGGEDSWEPLGVQRSDHSILKEISPEYFTGRTDAEAIIWLRITQNWLILKDPGAGKDGRQEEKGTIKDEMVGSHHQLDGHEFEQALGVGDGQGSLACWSPWGCKESDANEWLN